MSDSGILISGKLCRFGDVSFSDPAMNLTLCFSFGLSCLVLLAVLLSRLFLELDSALLSGLKYEDMARSLPEGFVTAQPGK